MDEIDCPVRYEKCVKEMWIGMVSERRRKREEYSNVALVVHHYFWDDKFSTCNQTIPLPLFYWKNKKGKFPPKIMLKSLIAMCKFWVQNLETNGMW